MPEESVTITENVAVDVNLSVNNKWKIDVGSTVGLDTNRTVNTYPIMGYLYEPTDIEGYQVQVQGELYDFYYIIDDSNELTEMYWGPQPLSQNTTNDQYQPSRLK